MYRIYFLIIPLLLAFNLLAAQIKLQTELIGSLGNAGDGNNIKITYTVGDIMTLTGKGSAPGPRVITQGFLQPASDSVGPVFDCDQVANVLTPTGTFGENDSWVIDGIERHPENKVKVFDRWGREVFSKDNYLNQNPWAATGKNNEILEEGPYFFHILLIDTREECRGTITILK